MKLLRNGLLKNSLLRRRRGDETQTFRAFVGNVRVSSPRLLLFQLAANIKLPEPTAVDAVSSVPQRGTVYVAVRRWLNSAAPALPTMKSFGPPILGVSCHIKSL
jgi:hypothetical protein